MEYFFIIIYISCDLRLSWPSLNYTTSEGIEYFSEKSEQISFYRGIQWHFKPPILPNMGDVSEWAIRAINLAMYKISQTQFWMSFSSKLYSRMLNVSWIICHLLKLAMPAMIYNDQPKIISCYEDMKCKDLHVRIIDKNTYNTSWNYWKSVGFQNICLNLHIDQNGWQIYYQGRQGNAKWPLGKIIDVIPSDNNVTSAIKVRTEHEEYVETAIKICSLERLNWWSYSRCEGRGW